MYTFENLEEKTVRELREIVYHDLHISGMSRARKDDLIDAIMETIEDNDEGFETTPDARDAVDAVDANLFSRVTMPGEEYGNRITTTIQVSSGANTDRFNVIGKTCGAVADLLREALNISEFASPIVNGKKADGSYVIREGDVLEYLKPAGSKG